MGSAAGEPLGSLAVLFAARQRCGDCDALCSPEMQVEGDPSECAGKYPIAESAVPLS